MSTWIKRDDFKLITKWDRLRLFFKPTRSYGSVDGVVHYKERNGIKYIFGFDVIPEVDAGTATLPPQQRIRKGKGTDVK